jgi:hypothetical protein
LPSRNALDVCGRSRCAAATEIDDRDRSSCPRARTTTNALDRVAPAQRERRDRSFGCTRATPNEQADGSKSERAPTPRPAFRSSAKSPSCRCFDLEMPHLRDAAASRALQRRVRVELLLYGKEQTRPAGLVLRTQVQPRVE